MKPIPFSPPDITQDEIDEVVDALKSGWITTGPKTKQLEKEVAKRCETNKAVCLNSNTACSEMTLRLLGIGPGDEVIVPAYTYTATVSPILHVGAIPVMVDCKKGEFSMDMEAVMEAITPKTKAIIAVDLFGIPADYEKLLSVVEEKRSLFVPGNNEIQKSLGRIAILADAAHSFGAKLHGKPANLYPDFASYSFHAVKNLTTAEGGAVVWNSLEGIDDEDLYHQYMLLSLHGQSKDALSKTKLGSWEYDIAGPFFKCNMTDVHAAIGLAQSRRYDDMLARRKEIIETYDKAFKNQGIHTLDHFTDNHESSGHLYVIRLFDKEGKPFEEQKRNQFIEELGQRGFSANVHYKPLPLMTGYQKLGFSIGDYPNAYAQYQNAVTLPLHTVLDDEQVQYIIDTVLDVYEYLS